MNEHGWIKEFPGAVTVCDSLGIIIEMNDKAAGTFEKDGGYALIGKNLLDTWRASQQRVRGPTEATMHGADHRDSGHCE